MKAEDSESYRGYRRLAGAVLVQAIEDIRRGSGRVREDALRWVSESSESDISFSACCRSLGRDPGEVRRSLVRQGLPKWAVGLSSWHPQGMSRGCRGG